MKGGSTLLAHIGALNIHERRIGDLGLPARFDDLRHAELVALLRLPAILCLDYKYGENRQVKRAERGGCGR